MTTCLGKSLHSVYYACLSWAFVKFCMCPSFRFGIKGRTWDVIVLIPVHCLSIYVMFKSDKNTSELFSFFTFFPHNSPEFRYCPVRLS